MSTIVYQGLQSCLEPQLKETTTLRLKLAAPKSIGILGSRGVPYNNTKEVAENWHNENTTNQITSNPDLGGWNFLQSLSNSSQIPKKSMDIETTHVPYSSLRLSQKSLELCTENLGSETGSDTSESSIFSLSSTDSWCEKSPTRELYSSRQFSSAKKANLRSFPPPLTTIRGSNSLQVRPHREGGRLIIEAVEAPSTRTYFEAERSHGRLKLTFLKNCDFMYDQKVDSQENEESGEDDNNIGEIGNEENNSDENPKRDDEGFEVEEEEDYEEKNGAYLKIVEEENGAYVNKDVDGNRKDVEVEMGMEKFQRSSGRKEGGRGTDNGWLLLKVLICWDPYSIFKFHN